jgi:hypothetical protein
MGILLPLRFVYLPYYLAIFATCVLAKILAGPIGLMLVAIPSWMMLVAYHAIVMDREDIAEMKSREAASKQRASDGGNAAKDT